jgi:hypothetical protein
MKPVMQVNPLSPAQSSTYSKAKFKSNSTFDFFWFLLFQGASGFFRFVFFTGRLRQCTDAMQFRSMRNLCFGGKKSWYFRTLCFMRLQRSTLVRFLKTATTISLFFTTTIICKAEMAFMFHAQCQWTSKKAPIELAFTRKQSFCRGKIKLALI